MIKITLNDLQAVKSLQQIANQLENPRRMYGILGETLKKIHTDRFKAETDPEGRKWKPLLSDQKGLFGSLWDDVKFGANFLGNMLGECVWGQ